MLRKKEAQVKSIIVIHLHLKIDSTKVWEEDMVLGLMEALSIGTLC